MSDDFASRHQDLIDEARKRVGWRAASPIRDDYATRQAQNRAANALLGEAQNRLDDVACEAWELLTRNNVAPDIAVTAQVNSLGNSSDSAFGTVSSGWRLKVQSPGRQVRRYEEEVIDQDSQFNSTRMVMRYETVDWSYCIARGGLCRYEPDNLFFEQAGNSWLGKQSRGIPRIGSSHLSFYHVDDAGLADRIVKEILEMLVIRGLI